VSTGRITDSKQATVNRKQRSENTNENDQAHGIMHFNSNYKTYYDYMTYTKLVRVSTKVQHTVLNSLSHTGKLIQNLPLVK